MGVACRAWLPIQMWYRIIVPVLAGGAMAGAGFLPWIVEPLQSPVIAWQIPVDIGWQIRAGWFNYGLLCLLCAIYPLMIAYGAWRSIIAPNTCRLPWCRTRSCLLAAWMGCILVCLWLWQYLFVDLGGMARLTSQEMQYLLIVQHLDYAVVNPLIPVAYPLELDPLSLSTRFTLLVDQLGIGPFLLLCAAILLVAGRKLVMSGSSPLSLASARGETGYAMLHITKEAKEASWRARPLVRWVPAFVMVLFLVVFVRAPLALVCNYQAQQALYTGDYAGALAWSGYASAFNPALKLLFSYHATVGQAWYFLHPDQPNVDSRAYLAVAYLEQKDYLAAYQELQRTWQSGKRAPWLVDEMRVALMQLAIVSLPRTTVSNLQRPSEDSAALAWFNQLLTIEPNNVFGQYMAGRIQYDLHNYAQCEIAMGRVIALSQSTNVLSSAYTYLALSSDGEGDYTDARVFLLRAVSLDPKYRNNTAREELSGLR